MIRCSGTNTSVAIRQLEPDELIPATNQVSSISRSVNGMSARPWSISWPSASRIGKPRIAQLACHDPEL